jgi:hypothetical protein
MTTWMTTQMTIPEDNSRCHRDDKLDGKTDDNPDDSRDGNPEKYQMRTQLTTPDENIS